MMSQDDSYVLQNLIGTTLCESLLVHALNQVILPSFTVFMLSYVQPTKILTGFPATTRGVSMQNTSQTRISWNLGT
jgi:hypothetical protein